MLDQAGWRTSPKLRVPENISLLPLPPYAPELNPGEQSWAYLRANFLGHHVWNSCNAIVNACCDAWNKLMNTPERLASIARRIWAKAVSTRGSWYASLASPLVRSDDDFLRWEVAGMLACAFD